MISAHELRIGNWINVGNVNIPRQVSLISDTYLCLKGNVGNYAIETFDPIPLTPDILEKAGFVDDKHLHWLEYSINGRVSYLSLTCGNYQWVYTNQLADLEKYPVIRIKHLHQLQNLYFALTGVELEINDL